MISCMCNVTLSVSDALCQVQTVVGGQDDGKAMQVCEVCGALLVVGDAQQRVDEHLLGKQHMGYAKVRDYVNNHREKTRVSYNITSLYVNATYSHILKLHYCSVIRFKLFCIIFAIAYCRRNVERILNEKPV